ncbi:MAG: hypothetical protein DRQ57_13385 [Gammaproteobacteria bacterium]|nr:MAG: hypothetical protein DRQ57_13385 [Gammaproteobacteria bacterium]
MIIKDNFFIQKMQIFIKKNLSKIAKNGLIMNTLKNYKNTISLKLYFFCILNLGVEIRFFPKI